MPVSAAISWPTTGQNSKSLVQCWLFRAEPDLGPEKSHRLRQLRGQPKPPAASGPTRASAGAAAEAGAYGRRPRVSRSREPSPRPAGSSPGAEGRDPGRQVAGGQPGVSRSREPRPKPVLSLHLYMSPKQGDSLPKMLFFLDFYMRIAVGHATRSPRQKHHSVSEPSKTRLSSTPTKRSLLCESASFELLCPLEPVPKEGFMSETLETRLSSMRNAPYCPSLHHFRSSVHWNRFRDCDSVKESGKRPTSGDSVEASAKL